MDKRREKDQVSALSMVMDQRLSCTVEESVEDGLFWMSAILKVFMIDLLLSGDNAVVIAMVCRTLPPKQRHQAMVAGTALAIGMRLVLSIGVSALLTIPGLKIAGAVALIGIGVHLLCQDEAAAAEKPPAANLRAAIITIFIADLAMSVDNVIGLAAAANGSIWILAFGLLLSVPLLMWGSVFVGRLLQRYPALLWGGGGLLGWIGGEIAVSDPVWADWVAAQAAWMHHALAPVGAGLVVAGALLVRRVRA